MSRAGPGAARGWPWYPVAIAVAIVLQPYTVEPIDPAAGVRALLVAVAISGALTVIWVRVLGRDRGGAAAAVSIATIVAAVEPFVLPLFGLAVVILALDARRARASRIPWPTVTRSGNTFLAVLLVLQLARGVLTAQVPAPVPVDWGTSDAAAMVDRPDVILVILDGHPRRDVLEQGYGSSMEPLATALSDAGFVESPNSFANHSITRFSLAVLLNGRPLADLGQDMEAQASDRVAYGAIAAGDGIRAFREAGYTTTVISSGYDHLPLRGVDRYIDTGPRNELEQAIIDTAPTGRWLDEQTGWYVASTRDRVLRQVDELRSLTKAQAGRPELALVHIPVPHFPLALRADCSLRPPDAYTRSAFGRSHAKGDDTAVRALAEQTTCIDALVAPVIGELAAARPGAVVVVFSDHGPEERMDWNHPDETGTFERLANLFWARTPGHADLFGPSPTLVNVLPRIANAYLGTNVALHPDDLFLVGPTPATSLFAPYPMPSP